MTGLWLLMMIIMINLFTSTLTSYMTVIKLKPIPNTLEELAASNEYRITMEKGVVVTDVLLVYNLYYSTIPMRIFQEYYCFLLRFSGCEKWNV